MNARAKQWEAAGRRVLLTGASGFIGSRLAARLVDAGALVHAVSRVPRGTLSAGVHWWPLDLGDEPGTRSVVEAVAPEVIVHVAGWPVGARSVAEVAPTFRSNLASTVNLLLAATQCGKPRVVLTGSLEEPVSNALHECASSPYALSKWAARAYGRMFHELFELPVVTLRVFMVYGPGQRDVKKLIPYSILAFLRGEPPRLSSGQREVDWVFVDDVVEAYLAAAFTPGIAGAAADIGSGRLVSIRDLVRQIAMVLDTSIEPQFGALADRPREQVRVADLSTAARVLGWQPRVPLEQGLRLTAAWYRDELRAGRV
ncbi:MAG: NAD(P)-dependent oxidoreductase [Planctomycetota bacterium]